jgi:hypothetical protein
MGKRSSNPLSQKNDRIIRNTLIIHHIQQRVQSRSSPLKIIESDVARFLGPISRPQSPLGYMRVALWPAQRVRVVVVVTACYRLAIAPPYARCGTTWWLSQIIMARVMGGWAGKNLVRL